MTITEVNVVLVKPRNGLTGFASLVLNDSIYLSSIAIYTKLNGGYRLLYPTKAAGNNSSSLFHPINRKTSDAIERAIFEKCNEIFKGTNEDHGHGNPSN